MAEIIQPDSYQEEFQVFPYEDLIRIRHQLIKDIHGFETSQQPRDGYIEISEASSPYTEYVVNLFHLSEICLMLIKSYPRELEEKLRTRHPRKSFSDNLSKAPDET